jgi:hypothetical protein
MRYISFVLAIAILVSAGTCAAQQAGDTKGPALKEKAVDSNNDGKIDYVDYYNERGQLVRRGYDADGNGVMERYDSYDPETGLPAVVPSDEDYEIR